MKPTLMIMLIMALTGFAPEVLETQTGRASYYSDALHGKKTASGEKYDRNGFTAAHRKFDFGSKVRVTNLKNGKSVIVTVTDRGPYSKTRIIDMSRAAALEIDMIDHGVINVKIELLAGD